MTLRGLKPLVAAVLLVVAAACSSGDDDDTAGNATSTGAPEVLRILVTNDDGVGGEGIDALVAGLEALPDVQVTVVAPAEDRSGTGDSLSDTTPTASPATLLSGHAAIAVAGFPADTIIHALDNVLEEEPHVVVSGVNLGQNLGPVVAISGTVGAARMAARRGIPALAVSQGLADTLDYDSGVALAVDWVEDHWDELIDGEVTVDTVANLNVPTCVTGEIRGLLELPNATEGVERVLNPSDCTSSLTDPVDDLDGFLNGFATLTEVPLDLPTAPAP